MPVYGPGDEIPGRNIDTKLLNRETRLLLEDLREMLAYYEDRADIDEFGGPNQAMTFMILIRDTIAWIERKAS